MNEQTMLGLLLRVHALVAAQELNERSRHLNISAANCYEMAQQHIESAIWNVVFAEQHIRAQEAQKAAAAKKSGEVLA